MFVKKDTKTFKIVENLAKAVDVMFEHLHLDQFVPPTIRYIIMGVLVSCPIWLMGMLLCLGDFDDQRRRESKKSSKVAKEEKMKEKIKRKVEREFKQEQARKQMELKGKRHEFQEM